MSISLESEPYTLLSNLFAGSPSRVWSSLDLYKEYASLGGTSLSRKELVQKLVAEYKKDILLYLHLE